MSKLLDLFRQVETALEAIDHQFPEERTSEYMKTLWSKLQAKKALLLTTLLELAGTMGLELSGERPFYYFHPSFVQPTPHIKYSPRALKTIGIEEIIGEPNLFHALLEALLSNLEKMVSDSFTFLERYELLTQRIEEVNEKREKIGFSPDLSLSEFFGVFERNKLDTRTYNCLARRNYVTLGSVLNAEASQLLAISNFGVGCLVTLYRKLYERGCLEQAKSWPPDQFYYSRVKKEMEKSWPEGKLP